MFSGRFSIVSNGFWAVLHRFYDVFSFGVVVMHGDRRLCCRPVLVVVLPFLVENKMLLVFLLIAIKVMVVVRVFS